MKKTKKVYSSPTITIKKLELNFFYRNNSRSTDSMNGLLGIDIAQSSGGCGGCGSCNPPAAV